MEREWLICLEGYTTGGIRIEYKYFKDDDGYELIIYRGDNSNNAGVRTLYKTNVELVKAVLNDVGGWLFVKQVPMKYPFTNKFSLIFFIRLFNVSSFLKK